MRGIRESASRLDAAYHASSGASNLSADVFNMLISSAATCHIGRIGEHMPCSMTAWHYMAPAAGGCVGTRALSQGDAGSATRATTAPPTRRGRWCTSVRNATSYAPNSFNSPSHGSLFLKRGKLSRAICHGSCDGHVTVSSHLPGGERHQHAGSSHQPTKVGSITPAPIRVKLITSVIRAHHIKVSRISPSGMDPTGIYQPTRQRGRRIAVRPFDFPPTVTSS